jgi:hypothetical protein
MSGSHAYKLLGAAATAPVQTDPSRDRERLITRAEFQQMLAVSRATLERLLARKRMLPPIVLSRTCHRWQLGTVLDWLRDGCPDPAAWLKVRH